MCKRLTAMTLILLVASGCKAIPTAPDPGAPLDRTYTNADWGFSISAPQDSMWSLSAIQFFAQREPNGLAPVQVTLRRVNPGQAWRPALQLNSFGLSEAEPLDSVAASFEQIFQADFVSYNTFGERRTGTVGGVPTVEWNFRAREPQTGVHFLNNRFLSIVFMRDDQVYQVLCSGQQGGFPEEDFRSILATFAFSR